MGVTERRQRERAARRGEILDAARDVLLSQGLRGTTTKEIAERCELSEATLFFYFRNKDEILLSLIFESIAFWAQGLDALAAKSLPPEELLQAIWQFHEEVYREHPDYFVISAYLAQPQVLDNVSPEVKAEIAHRSGENFRRLRDLLGRVDPSTPGVVLANMLWSLFLGLTIAGASRANLGHGTRGEQRETRTQVFDVVKRAFGFGARDAPPGVGRSKGAAARNRTPRRAAGSNKS
ncbi:MAG: TetR/AcrR family transcriptional regulator [Burkholderiaceae bacterium]|nr:TetR/AcrR family transcriptional regulator [Burkholderiaceae bacterium]MEB2351645.1 TetR/AcrR family transcriptional regulator [Burkholderiaceae bacterium]